MLRTTSAVGTHLPDVLARLAIGYVTAQHRTMKHIALAGEWETCLAAADYDVGGALRGACRGNHVHLARALVEPGARNVNCGLVEACRFGYIGMVRFMICQGADDCNYALRAACRGGPP